MELWKNEEKKVQCRELFLLCDKGRTEDLFGEKFAALVDARKSVNELAEEEESQTPVQAKIDGKREEVGKKFQSSIEIRTQKRKRLEVSSEPEEEESQPVQAKIDEKLEEVGKKSQQAVETRAQKRKRLEISSELEVATKKQLPVRNKG